MMKFLVALLTVSSVVMADVDLPTPPGLDNHATVTVLGEPGMGQENLKYCVSSFELNEQGKPERFTAVQVGCAKLNESVHLIPFGGAFVTYGESLYVMSVSSKAPIQIQLKKMNVREVPTGYQYATFVDLTDANEKMKFDVIILTHSGNKAFYEGLVKLKRDGKCGVLCEKDWLFFEGLNMEGSNKIDSVTGAMSAASFCFVYNGCDRQTKPYGHESHGFYDHRLISRYSESIGFVSVLPGVYGIAWRQQASGKVAYVLKNRIQ